ncbi:repressor LexA [Psychromonas sp. MB-3u-54]|uniref:transcriptional repressor LexA n=1 Tax=Psychromonas sp. MB-3u-54 TaxID=2058319 RepID=UPI000C32168E|nr:transcriptional repressor LexA [Psychromonas sp. MB-3u-54]PKH01109.1 repressor LexA [Psychromonas sp. MB-3u-54]
MKELTKRQNEVLDVIKDQILKTGMPPTRAELAKILGFRSANAAEEHLKALARKGAIEILAGTSRGIRLLGEHQHNEKASEDGLPLIGQVAAGEPILAQQHIETYYDVDPALFHPSADFLLRVQGESMKDIGIMDGDLLAVHKTQDIKNGQVVVARVEDDVTVKRFYREGRQVILKAENNHFGPIKIDLAYQSFDIEGIAVGVIRTADWM